MPAKSVKTYLVAFQPDSIKQNTASLIYANLGVEFLDPFELGEKWESVKKLNIETTNNQDQMVLLDDLIKKEKLKKKPGIFGALLDTRENSNLETLLTSSENNPGLIETCHQLKKYFDLLTTKHTILDFQEKNKSKLSNFSYFTGQDLDQIESKYTEITESVLDSLTQKDINLESQQISKKPTFKLTTQNNFNILQVEKEFEEDLTGIVLPKISGEICLLEVFYRDLTLEIEGIKEKDFDLILEEKYLVSGFIKKLKLAYSNLELDEKINKNLENFFKLDEKSTSSYIFVAVPEKNSTEIENFLEKHSLMYEENDWSKEIVDWKNPDSLSGFQGLAQSIGTIDSKEADPTKVVGFFYVLFFAFCLNDAIYGLLLASITGYLLFYKKVKSSFRSTLNLFFYSGLGAVLYGMLANGWAGDLFNSELAKEILHTEKGSETFIQHILNNFVLIDVLAKDSHAPINRLIGGTSPILLMLLVAAGVGFMHIFSGYILKIITSIKEKNYLEVGNRLAWIFFLASMFFAIGFSGKFDLISKIWLVLGILGLVIFNQSKGFFGKILGAIFSEGGLWGLIGLVANIMSYTRLVAVGLTGGIIANIVNLLAGLVFTGVGGVPGFVLALVVLLGGHIFNIVLSIFSAYINPLRLTYVEFMPSFFEGKGRQIQKTDLGFKYLEVLKG